MSKNPFVFFLLALPLLSQAPLPTTLLVEIDNWVEYLSDSDEVMKFATNPNTTDPRLPNTLFTANHLGDIVSVNGKPAKGFLLNSVRVIGATTTATAGRPIADVNRSSFRQQYFEIQNADGTPIGTIIGVGMHGPQLPPGTPSGIVNGNYAIIGGTGAYLGARGQSGLNSTIRPARLASVEEDPSRRRLNGGGRLRFSLTFYPMVYPAVLTSQGAPAIVHANDFGMVSAERPAVAGEILALYASALGPTRPSVDWGTPFPLNTSSVVNSPIEVSINGVAAEVLAAVGYPGAVDGYQVNFRMPSGLSPGTATLRISSAYINSPTVSIPVR